MELIKMKLQLTNQTQSQIASELFENILTEIPEAKQGTLELLLTDNATIQELNKTYRKKDKPTDVLSFPFDESENLGQIVISVERAQTQADEIGQSLEEELIFLFTHGVLHLLGYDHEDHEDEKVMLAKTYKILGRTA